MRHGLLASVLIGIGYFLQHPKVNEGTYNAEYVADSLIGSESKMKGVVYPLMYNDFYRDYNNLLSPLISNSLWKKISEVNNYPRNFRRRETLRETFVDWNATLLKKYPRTSRGVGTKIEIQPQTIGSSIDDAWMHNRHSRGRFTDKDSFIANFIHIYLGVGRPNQHIRIISGIEYGELIFKTYCVSWLNSVAELNLDNLLGGGLEEYRRGPVGKSSKVKAVQEYYAHVHDTYIEKTGVKPMIPTWSAENGIQGGRVDTVDNAGIWLTEKKSQIVAKHQAANGIISGAQKHSDGIIEQKVMPDLNAAFRKVISSWEGSIYNKSQLEEAKNNPYFIYDLTVRRGEGYSKVGLIPPYTGWDMRNTVKVFEEYLDGLHLELKKWLPKIRKANRKDDKDALEKWLLDDAELPAGQSEWVDESLQSYSGLKRSNTQSAKRERWFEQSFMKGIEMDYSSNYYTGGRGYGLNRLSNDDMMAFIPKSEAERLITKYTKEQNKSDKNAIEWRKVRDAKLKNTIANLK